MPRTIPPIRPQAPDSWPSILTVAQEGGLADAYNLDPTAGWQVGVQSLDLEGQGVAHDASGRELWRVDRRETSAEARPGLAIGAQVAQPDLR